MSTVYADRGFLSMNGVEFQDVENISMKRNKGTRYVPTMTRDGFNKGVVTSNMEIHLSFTAAVQNQLATPKLEALDYENNSVSLTFAHGADRYSLHGLQLVDVDQSAPGVGQEGKKTYNFLALKCVDQVGNSALFDLSL